MQCITREKSGFTFEIYEYNDNSLDFSVRKGQEVISINNLNYVLNIISSVIGGDELEKRKEIINGNAIVGTKEEVEKIKKAFLEAIEQDQHFIDAVREDFELTTGKGKIYIADLKFVCGEYEQTSFKVVSARDSEEAEEKIDKYLKTYYGKNLAWVDNNTYFYFSGEVAVKFNGLTELTDTQYLLSLLEI